MSDLAADWRERFDMGMLDRISVLRREDGGRPLHHDAESLLEGTAFESPIEIVLCWAVMNHRMNDSGIGVWLERRPGPIEFDYALGRFDEFCVNCSCTMLFGPDYKMGIFPQTKIGRNRADFLILARDWYGHPSYDRPTCAFVVECDGHDYHERTKAQAVRDKSRDRSMAISRLHVLRFTGSEIISASGACAEQVWDFVRSHR